MKIEKKMIYILQKTNNSLQDVSNNWTFHKHIICTVSKQQDITQLAPHNNNQTISKLNQHQPMRQKLGL